MKTFQTFDTTFVPAGSELKASPGRTEMRASSALLQVCRKGRGNAVCRKRLSLSPVHDGQQAPSSGFCLFHFRLDVTPVKMSQHKGALIPAEALLTRLISPCLLPFLCVQSAGLEEG